MARKMGRPPLSDVNRVVACTVDDGITPAMIDAAERRVMPLLVNLRLMDFDLKRLLVSCYLQGVRDLAETLVNKGEYKC